MHDFTTQLLEHMTIRTLNLSSLFPGVSKRDSVEWENAGHLQQSDFKCHIFYLNSNNNLRADVTKCAAESPLR